MRRARYTGTHVPGTSTRPLRALALDVALWFVAVVVAFHVVGLDWTI